MSKYRDTCFVVVGPAVTKWAGWNDAIAEVHRAYHGIFDPRSIWLRDTGKGVCVFKGKPDDCHQIAIIFLSEPQYQAAKSRGDIP